MGLYYDTREDCLVNQKCLMSVYIHRHDALSMKHLILDRAWFLKQEYLNRFLGCTRTLSGGLRTVVGIFGLF